MRTLASRIHRRDIDHLYPNLAVPFGLVLRAWETRLPAPQSEGASEHVGPVAGKPVLTVFRAL